MSLLSRLKSAYNDVFHDPDIERVMELILDDKIKVAEKKWAEMKPLKKLQMFYKPKVYLATTVIAALLFGGAVVKSFIDEYNHFMGDRINFKTSSDELESLKEFYKGLVKQETAVDQKSAADIANIRENVELETFLNTIKMSGLPLISAFDVNQNFIHDSIDSFISQELLQNKKILSPEFISSVRMLYSSDVLEKLAEYGITKPVICVNENTLVVYTDGNVEKVIPNVPKDKLHDFVIKPGNYYSIDAILNNKVPHSPTIACIHVLENTKFSRGSGIVLCDGYIATALHVVDGYSNGDIIVKLSNGKKAVGSTSSIIASSKEHDLAILKLDFGGCLPIVLEDNLRVGDDLHFLRRELGLNRDKSEKEEGTLYSIEQTIFDYLICKDNEISGRDTYLTTLSMCAGDSGSGVFDCRDRLVGIATRAVSAKAGVSTVRRTKYLRQLLEYCKEQSK